jgi:hypothetical protein
MSNNNQKKIQIIEMMVIKRKVKRHFMKKSDNVSNGGNHQNNSLFSFSTSRFQFFLISRMSAEESIVEKLQRLFRKKL